jgi:hypothetical protein
LDEYARRSGLQDRVDQDDIDPHLDWKQRLHTTFICGGVNCMQPNLS